jgi:N-acetyl sugar amidotransferase
MIRFCKKCVMPETKPDLKIDHEGVCSACRFYENRAPANYEFRQKELHQILQKYRSADGKNWDCLIPVSGGKDSTYQVIKMLELGMNPLCVTSTTCHESDLGRKNILNLQKLGVDHIQVTPNPVVRKKLNRIGLRMVGDISWPEHVGIFTIPIRVATQYGIKLIIWGENSQHEYGGPASAAENSFLDRRWLEEFGGLLGMRVSDLIGMEDIKASDLVTYQYPSIDELDQAKISGLFLGYYFSWDGLSNALISTAHGFTSFPSTIEGSVVNYENVDNYQTGIHDYFKFLKFGFGRATDLACLHIRRERISREQAVKLVKMHDGKFPWTYLGKPIEEILSHIEMSLEEFIQICDKFTNKKIFKTDLKGNLVKDSKGNLTPLYLPS